MKAEPALPVYDDAFSKAHSQQRLEGRDGVNSANTIVEVCGVDALMAAANRSGHHDT